MDRRGDVSLTDTGPRGRSTQMNTSYKLGRSVSRPSTRYAPSNLSGRAWNEDMEVSRLNTTSRPRQWIADLSGLPRHFMRVILGRNPFKTSYFSLYRPIDTLQSKAILACAITFAIVAGVPLPVVGYLFGQIIDDFPPPEGELLTLLEELIGVAVAYFLVTWVWSVCWGIVGEKVSRGLREALVHKAIGMDLAYYDVHDPDITSILTGDTQTIQTGTSEKVGLFIQSVSYFVAAFVVGFILNAQLTGILFAAVIPLMFIVVISGTTLVSRFSKRASGFSEQAAQLAESAINAVEVVQAFGAGKTLCNQHSSILTKARRAGFKKGIAGAIMLGAVYFLAYAANALAFWEGSQLVSGGGAGTVYAVVFLILDASFVVGQFGPFIQSLALAASAGGKVLEIIDREQPEIDVYSDEGIKVDDEMAKQDLHLDEITFVYPARSSLRVLDGLSLHFRAHTTTGIVGLSGSGKSTVAGLLLRLYDATSGVVRLGDTDVKDLHLPSLRAHISLVDQEPVLFTGTILDNISHGIVAKDQLSEEEILKRCIDAASAANANFVSDLANGIRTEIGGAGGTQLSGGQKQRICLARALVRNPSILILDEPTSALDATSETLILEALKEVSTKGCTIIMIAHRLATIKDADNIMVMNAGSLMEEGSHDDLMKTDGPYSQLVEAQKLHRDSEAEKDQPSTNHPSASAPKQSDIKDDLEAAAKISDADQGEKQTDRTSKDKSLPIKELFARCFAISKPERFWIFLGLLGSMVSGSLILGEAIIFGNLVSLLNTSSGSPGYQSQVDFFCLMFFVVALVAICAYSTSGCSFGIVSEHLVQRTRDISLHTILQQDMAWFSEEGHATSELMSSVNTNASNLSGLSGVILGTLFSVATSIIGGIILAHAIAWKIAVVLLAAVPVMVLAGFLRLRVLAKFEQRQETAYNEAASLASEACRAIRTVAAFGREKDVEEQYRVALERPYKKGQKFLVLGNLMLAFSLAITYFVYALAYWWGSQQVRNGTYSQKQFFTVLPALLFSAQSSGQMFSLAPELTKAKAAANSIFTLHDQKPSIMSTDDESSAEGSSKVDAEKVSANSSSTATNSQASQLAFQGVSLSYPTRPDTFVLQDASFEIEQGQFIGVVGPSGAGKSSLVALLERFYDPVVGSILFEGTNILDIPVRDYRARLSLVSQEPELFSGSISFNIGLGASPGQTVTQDDIEATCRLLNIHEFVMSLPEGYSTECGINGSKLSGGQKQRVAIARALVRDPDILLLDEATASLDAHSDAEVQDAVAATKEKNRTTIVVAHRLSTVQNADSILVFDHGELVERGTHEELISQQGVYAAMVKAQELG